MVGLTSLCFLFLQDLGSSSFCSPNIQALIPQATKISVQCLGLLVTDVCMAFEGLDL